MSALAAIPDVEAVSRPVPGADEARVTRLLELVSDAVRGYTGQIFDLVEDDVVTVHPRDGVVRLPQHPVTAVSAVSEIGAVLDPASWEFTENGYLSRVVPAAYRRREWLWCGAALTVTYTHGYPRNGYPGDLKLVVAEQVAEKWIRNVDSSIAQESETIGTYSHSVTYRDMGQLASGAGWAPAHLAILDTYRRSGLASVRLG